jgi:UDP-2,3-diacylglucosamine pyrophosphatase LpxH
MIAIISDLHLQHTRWDSLRYRMEGRLYETGVRRNVNAGAFTHFTGMIDAAMKKHAAEAGQSAVDLVFAGDVFEVHRTPLWFAGPDNLVRPYGQGTQDDEKLEARTLGILEHVEEENCRFFRAVGDYVEEHSSPQADYSVEVHYIPGNHDRLLNKWPSTRDKVRSLLGIKAGTNDDQFPNCLDFPDHHVRVRHGHEYDKSGVNLGFRVNTADSLKQNPNAYLAPCFGDYATIDIATRLAAAFRIFHAAMLHGTGAESSRQAKATSANLRRLYQALLEFDDVRPTSHLFAYLSSATGLKNAALMGYLEPALIDAIKALVADAFVQREAGRLSRLGGPLKTCAKGLEKLLPKSAATKLARVLFTASSDAEPAELARREPGLGSEFDLVVAGHTHYAGERAMSRPDTTGTQQYFLDTGTWRTITREGLAGCFARTRDYTMAFCYTDVERTAHDGRRFETWTGRLAWRPDADKITEQSVPYDVPIPDADPGPGPMGLRFTEVILEKMPWDWRGPDVRIHLGLDGTELPQVFAKDNASLSVPYAVQQGDAIRIDPGLDGEVWAYGKEVDPTSRDDPLPWAFARLERGDEGEFAEADGALHLRNKDVHVIVSYEVRPI